MLVYLGESLELANHGNVVGILCIQCSCVHPRFSRCANKRENERVRERVWRTDDGTHAGSTNDIDRNASLLKSPDHSCVCNTSSSSTAEYQADRGACKATCDTSQIALGIRMEQRWLLPSHGRTHKTRSEACTLALEGTHAWRDGSRTRSCVAECAAKCLQHCVGSIAPIELVPSVATVPIAAPAASGTGLTVRSASPGSKSRGIGPPLPHVATRDAPGARRLLVDVATHQSPNQYRRHTIGRLASPFIPVTWLGHQVLHASLDATARPCCARTARDGWPDRNPCVARATTACSWVRSSHQHVVARALCEPRFASCSARGAFRFGFESKRFIVNQSLPPLQEASQ